MPTVSNYLGLLSDYYWYPGAPAQRPVILTYSFVDVGAAGNSDPANVPFTGAIEPARQNLIRDALYNWESISGITFLETTVNEGDLNFGYYDLTAAPGTRSDGTTFIPAGDAGYPSSGAYFDNGLARIYGGDGENNGGVIRLNTGMTSFSDEDYIHIALHEIGHSLGLKHPFDGDIKLESSLDNGSNTVMSYNDYYPFLGTMDIQAIQAIYGDNNNDANYPFAWFWDANTETITQNGTIGSEYIKGTRTNDVIYSSGGRDAIYTYAGDDTVYSNLSFSEINFGPGVDRVVYNKVSSDYYIQQGSTDGSVFIYQKGDYSKYESLFNIEVVQFSDTVLYFNNYISPLPSDLVINFTPLLSSNSVAQGSSVTISYRVDNAGTVAASSSATGIYLSTDSTISTADTLLATDTVSTILAGGFSTESATVSTRGLNAGTYYLGVIADYNHAVSETNESNNTSTGISFTVTASILPDLVVDYTPSLSSSSVAQGSSVTISYRVDNAGAVAASSSAAGIYLSTDSTISTADTLLATEDVSAILTGGFSSGSATVSTRGLVAGTYYLGVTADYNNTVSESDESNNTSTGISFTVTAGILPDLVVDYTPSLSSSSVAQGSSVTISYRVDNTGTVAASSSAAGIYLSTDSTISTADTLLATEDVSAILTGGFSSGSATVSTSELAAGTYYLGVIADYNNATLESDESNNASTGISFTVNSSSQISHGTQDSLYDISRFYNTSTGAHFYTSSDAEGGSLIVSGGDFVYEGNAFDSNATNDTGLIVFRFYNTQTGVHFYTSSAEERASIVANLPQFNDEGFAYYAYADEGTGRQALHRFYNTDNGTHFYTASDAEQQQVATTLPQYRYEGVAYYVEVA